MRLALRGRCVTGVLLSLLVCRPAAGLDPRKAISQYVLDQWQEKEGLDQSTVQAIAQTRDGYLWMATRDRLVRFDGVRFTTFNSKNTPAILHHNISDVIAAPDGPNGEKCYGQSGSASLIHDFDDASDVLKGESFVAKMVKRKSEGGREYLRLERE